MTRLVSRSLKAYRRLLFLYPGDLVSEFGAEMIEAFTDDLLRACAADGVRGAVRVWRTALRELVRIALPSWLEIPGVAVPVLSAALVFVSQSPMLIRAIRYPRTAILRDTLLALAIEAAVTAVTSFAAIYRWKKARPISLDIG